MLPLLAGGSLIVEIFWLGSLAYLFLGRWPGGRGAAWESGQAEPWPTPAQRRKAEAEAEEIEPPEPETPTRRSSRKRRKKRR